MEGACEQFMWTGVLERDVEFHDGVPDTCDAYTLDSSERCNRYRDHTNP